MQIYYIAISLQKKHCHDVWSYCNNAMDEQMKDTQALHGLSLIYAQSASLSVSAVSGHGASQITFKYVQSINYNCWSWDNIAPVMEVLMVVKAKEIIYFQGEITCSWEVWM
jgi:hypothetical protein